MKVHGMKYNTDFPNLFHYSAPSTTKHLMLVHPCTIAVLFLLMDNIISRNLDWFILTTDSVLLELFKLISGNNFQTKKQAATSTCNCQTQRLSKMKGVTMNNSESTIYINDHRSWEKKEQYQ